MDDRLLEKQLQTCANLQRRNRIPDGEREKAKAREKLISEFSHERSVSHFLYSD